MAYNTETVALSIIVYNFDISLLCCVWNLRFFNCANKLKDIKQNVIKIINKYTIINKMTKTKNNNNNNKAKAAKRRVRNKRRKKLKQQQNQDDADAAAIVPEATATTTNSTQKAQPHHQKNEVNLEAQAKAQAKAQRLWRQTYENATNWIGLNQMNFWRQRVDVLQRENDQLRNQLNYKNVEKQEVEEYLTSSSSSSSEEENYDDVASEIEATEVDEGYLEFLQVTLQHREDLRKAREKEGKTN